MLLHIVHVVEVCVGIVVIAQGQCARGCRRDRELHVLRTRGAATVQPPRCCQSSDARHVLLVGYIPHFPSHEAGAAVKAGFELNVRGAADIRQVKQGDLVVVCVCYCARRCC